MTAMLPDAFAKACIETWFEDTLVSAHRVASARRTSSRRCSAAMPDRAPDVRLRLDRLTALRGGQGTIVDAEENRYYLSLEACLYLYVGPPEPYNRLLLRVRGPVSTRLLPGVAPSFLGLVLRLLCRGVGSLRVLSFLMAHGIIDRTKSMSDGSLP